jgi:predicted O-methyltransferase YrrM
MLAQLVQNMTSDDFFTQLDERAIFDVVFIDGMHQVDYVIRDINNAVRFIADGGYLFLDDILPMEKSEQLAVPAIHKYEDGILKYHMTPWTGDVWKVF